MTSAPAIGFEYRPSRWVARLFVAISVLAVLAVALSGMPTPAQVVVVVAVLIGCGRALRPLHLSVNAVGWAHASGWTLRGVDGTDEPASLLSFKAMRSLVLLQLGSPRYGRLTFWLMPDNSDADIRRRLRMRLAIIKAAAAKSAV
jgi:toxin CptA